MKRIAWSLAHVHFDRSWRRWLLIALAALLLTACRAPDVPISSIASQTPLAAPSLNGPTPQPNSPAVDTPSAVASQETAATLSLSDEAARTSRPTRDAHVALAQHTTSLPASVPAKGTFSTAVPRDDIPRAVTIPGTATAIPAAPPALPRAGAPQVAQSLVQAAPDSNYSQPGPSGYPQPYDQQPCGPLGNSPTQCAPETGCPDGVPCGGWRPPGLTCPWPDDEYLCDGGDKIPSVRVRQDWSVDGLQLEDTVVHFDTLDGDTHVEPSNRVCIYAPRFASVRKIYGVIQYDHLDRIARVDQPVPIEGLEDVQKATTNVQPVQPVLNHGTKMASGFREQTPPIGVENRQGLVGIHGNILPYEDITELQRRLLTNSEKARLADLILAAAVWSHDAAVQVVIDNIATHEEIATTAAGSVHIYSLEGKPRLRICKLASQKEARPGEEVEFTLQFENMGDQTIGNVTVIDNLTTRLEYVEDSEKCSLKSNFSSSDNQGNSLTLRWEVVEPMKVGEGGVIRFKCRVR